jgi:LPS export ABC transporter protein LptC
MKRIIFSLFAIVILVVLILTGYREDEVRISPSYKSSSMHGLYLTHKAGNEVKWELKAEDAIFPEGATEITIKSLELQIYDDHRIRLFAGTGTYNIDTKTLTINRPVRINIRDATLLTDRLTWDGQRGLIKTDEEITFSGRNFHIQGRGLEAEIRQERIRILNNVKGIFYL